MKKYFLTSMQQGVLFDYLKSPTNGYYIQQLICSFDKLVCKDILYEAWQKTIKKNKVLRTRFHTDASGETLQSFSEKLSFQFNILDGKSFEKETFLSKQRSTYIDIKKDALWSVTLVCSKDKTEMIWCFHHILLDGRSHSLILEDVFKFYNSIVEKISFNYSDIVEFSEYLELVNSLKLDSAFWNNELADVERTATLDVGESEVLCDDSEALFYEQESYFSKEETLKLIEFCEENSYSVNCLLQSAWAFLLYKYTGLGKIVFGTTRACRHLAGKDFSSTRGLLINTVPFVVNFKESMSVESLLSQVQKTQLRLRSVEGNSLVDISSSLPAKNSVDLLKSILVFENFNLNTYFKKIGGICDGMSVELREKINSFTLAGYLDERLTLSINYPLNNYSNNQIEYLLKHLKSILLSFVLNLSSKLQDFSFLTDNEKKLLLNEFAGSASKHNIESNFVDEFEQQVRKTPDNVAIELHDLTTISYRRLNNRANQLANYLISLGYKRGDCVAVCMDRCADLVISLMAIWKAGMVYVPIEVSNTRENISFYITNSGANVVLTLDRLSQNIPKVNVDVVLLDRDEYVICKQKSKNLNFKIDQLDVAYILYTSGTTGTPKGVEVYHRGIVSLVEETKKLLGMVEADRILLLSTPSFDLSLYEILMGVYVGATLCVALWENLMSGEAVSKTLQDRSITVVSVTPTTIRNAPILDGFQLRLVMCCGEVCTPDIFMKWGKGREWRFFNGYGPTEVTIWTTTKEYTDGLKKLPIGRPIKDRLCYVLDDKMNLQPIGVPGELYIGGAGGAKGYLNEPEENKKHYIQNPFVEADILYKTGDKVRYLSDGNLDYMHRVDNQVKIHGIRFELEEIESLLDGYKHIDKSVVVLLDDKKTIGAYVKTVDDKVVDQKIIKQFLESKLQSIFIPTIILKIDQFPATASGKIDRVALKENLKALLNNQTKEVEKKSFLLSETNRQLVLEKWNATEMELPDYKTILPIIQGVAADNPDGVAVIDQGREHTSKDLEEASNRVANYLKSQKIGAGDVVATYIDKSFEYIYATYGIMKAGAVFLPLSINYPADRIQYIVEDSDCKCLVTSLAYKDFITVDINIAVADELNEYSNACLYENFNVDSPAYIIYTSGSTGKPKGVLCSHLGLLNLCTFYKQRLQLTNSDRAGMIADVSFDASLADVWPYLCVGGGVCITDNNTVIDFHKLLEWLIKDRVTVSFISTVLAEMFFLAPGLGKLPLRYLLTGGDTLHSFPPIGYPCEVINTYGPTENTVDSTWYVVPQGGKGRPPIGKSIGNVRSYILNDELKPVEIGQKGELCLAGKQLAFEYLNRPELTKKQFVTVEINGKKERVYRTGDVVSWNKEGDIEFYGRSDNQIQICGVRTELGEVEGTMLQYEGVMEAAVAPVFDGNVIYALAGFYSVADVEKFDKKGFNEFLKSVLPAVLVPKKMQQMDGLPKNFAGKIDRKSLQVPTDIIVGETASFEFENEMEEKLLPIWSDVLSYPALTPTDNFFDVGGHSILMLKLVSAIEQKLNIHLDVSTLMQAHTVRELADIIKNKRSSYASKYVVDIKTDGNMTPVFCVAGIGGGSHWFRDFAKNLSDEQPFYCLEFMGLADEILRGSIDGMAEEFLKAIRDIQPSGPYIVGGFSDGGCVSFEIARQLREQDENVQMFFLIDAYGPNLDRSVLTGIKNYIKHFFILSWKEKMDFFKEKYEWKLYQFKNMFAKKEVKSDYDKIWELILLQHETVLNYNYQPMPGCIELFRAEKPPRSMPLDLEAGWTGLAKDGVNIHITPGNHYSIFKPPHGKQFVENFEKIISKNSANK